MQVLKRASWAKQKVDPIDLPGHDQFMQHSKGFLAVVEAARPIINEIDIKQARERLAKNSNAILIDVREDNELAIAPFTFSVLHLPLSKFKSWKDHLGDLLPDDQPIVVLCLSLIHI